MARTILIHLNVTVPDGYPATVADELLAEVRGAIEVGTDQGHTPWLTEADLAVVSAEEI